MPVLSTPPGTKSVTSFTVLLISFSPLVLKMESSVILVLKVTICSSLISLGKLYLKVLIINYTYKINIYKIPFLNIINNNSFILKRLKGGLRL